MHVTVEHLNSLFQLMNKAFRFDSMMQIARKNYSAGEESQSCNALVQTKNGLAKVPV